MYGFVEEVSAIVRFGSFFACRPGTCCAVGKVSQAMSADLVFVSSCCWMADWSPVSLIEILST